ncbi:hypothetical protein AB0D94_34855 [Streptomyces sp. NPDC048255]|uniref:hypothetical protein n=1 Tax=Streptomyces sp. NPDC048255 TaxID=3154713 RepID=UPI0033E12350
MARDGTTGGQLDELAAFALEHAAGAPAEGAGAAAVFLFADDVEDRYLYTFTELAEAYLHLADPAHGYLRCALAWCPAPGVFAVQAQEIGSSASFLLTRHHSTEGLPEGGTVRTEGAEPLLPVPGPVSRVQAGELAELEYEIDRAFDSGEGLAEAEDRVRRWVGRASEAEWEAAEEWVRGRLPAGDEPDPADDVLPERDLEGTRTPGRYSITFREGGAPGGREAALATWDQVARQARDILGPEAVADGGTALEVPGGGVRLALDRSSGAYELSVALPAGTAPAPATLTQLYQLALTVQLETGRRAIDPQAGWYVDQGAGAKWGRRLGLFSRAARAFRRGRS